MTVISVVVPVLNEETNIRVFHKRATGVFSDIPEDYEIIFVDDGSADNTLEILKELSANDNRIKVISFSRNFGHQSAITAGLDYAAGDAVAIIDGDLQDPPELIGEMIKKWKENYQVVYAQRTKRKGETVFKKLTASIFYRFFHYFTKSDMPLDAGDFRLVDRSVVEALKKLKEKNRFMRGLVNWVGFNQTPVFYERDERLSGETKYPLSKMIRFANNAIFSFSDRPLKIATVIGLTASAIGLLMILWGLYSKFFLGENTIKGWTSVFISVLFLGGVQLFTLGIIGEYIGRIYDETKSRPIYLVKEEVNFNKGDNN